MILHRDGPGRRTGASPRPGSVPELARVLRQARSAQGLELFQVSQQTGIPLDHLSDLESGTVDRLPDRVEILKALGSYASFLGLPGDQFVVTLVEHWPAAPNTVPVVVVHDDTDGTGRLAADRTPRATTPTGAELETKAIPLSMPKRDAPPTSAGLPVLTERHSSTAQVPVVMADTGKTPAVRRNGDGLGMALVRASVVVALVLVLIGTAWLVLNRVRPQWLADLRLPYTSQGAIAPSSGTTGGTGTTGAKGTTAATAAAPSMHLVSATGTQATFSVTSPRFDVQISASGGETWVQATGPLSTAPSYEGVLKNGQSQVVPADHQLVVRIGSIAARIAVRVDQRLIGTYVPPGAPFMMTFTAQ